MWRFITKGLIFGCYLAGFYLLIILISGSVIPHQLIKNFHFKGHGAGCLRERLLEVETVGEVDIVFLGSSHAYRGFDPRIFAKEGLKTFNLGSSAQTPLQTEVFVDRYIEQLSPSIVIFEVYPNIFKNNGVESGLDLLAHTNIDKPMIGMLNKVNNFKTYNTTFYSYFQDLCKGKNTIVDPPRVNQDLYIAGGYVERTTNNQTSTLEELKNLQPYKPAQFEALERILHQLAQMNIKVVLVQAPITNIKYVADIGQDEFFDHEMSSLTDYYNFNELMNLENNCFFDSHHLNQKGVDLFNTRLISILKADEVIPLDGFH